MTKINGWEHFMIGTYFLVHLKNSQRVIGTGENIQEKSNLVPNRLNANTITQQSND